MTAASLLGLTVLVTAHVAAGLAGFLAPYEPGEQHRDHAWSPPAANVQIRWFQRGPNGGYKLFRPADPGHIFLLGTDGLGRDQFTRLLYGCRISLYSGLAAAILSALLGALLGGMAGFFGGWTDRLIVSAAEVFQSLPWMYLLLAARAFFPLNADPLVLFAILLPAMGIVGWTRPARLVRGIVMSTKEADYVRAARGFGAGPAYLLVQHALPPAAPALLTYLTVAIPHYIVAEATLSFLGLGFSGSAPSLGSLISALTSLEVLRAYWWMWVPAMTLALILACYSVVADGLARPESRNR